MKKLLLVLVALVLTATLASAQDELTGTIGFGFKGGINLANLGGDDAEGIGAEQSEVVTDVTSEKKMWTSFLFGAFMTYQVTPSLTIQPELLYTMKGAKYEGTYDLDGETYSYENDAKLTYLEVPVLVKYTVPMQSSAHPFIYAGPSISFLLKANLATEVSNGFSNDMDIKDDMKSVDFGGVVGAGVDFPLGSGRLGLEGRYDLGLANVIDIEEVDVKTGTISALISYSIK